MRVPVFLAQNRVCCETVLHPPAFTAQKRAHFLHVPGRQVAKCVLLKGPAGPLLAVLPATHRVDCEALARALGGPVRLATRTEVAERFADCEWGVVPPFGTLYGLPTVLDESIDRDRPLLFEGHAHGVAVRMRCRDFERHERPRRLAFARPGHLPVA
jgi:Ala-tRNA(Pro) deacylase